MKIISNIFYYALIILMMAWMLPWLYDFAFYKPSSIPNYSFSPITRNFVHWEYKDGKSLYLDSDNNEYTQDQYDSLLPIQYYFILQSKNKALDSLEGYPINRMSVGMGMANGSGNPASIHRPSLGVKEILESTKYRLSLQDPTQVFRCKENSIEFINKSDNKIDTLKSRLFTEAFNAVGFHWPIVRSSGSPTSRKSYDFGYLVLDSNHEVYNMVQVHGKPYIRKTQVTPDMGITLLSMREPMNQAYFGYAIGKNESFYLIMRDYSVKKLDFKVDLNKNNFWLMGNMLYWTVTVTDDDGYDLYAINAHSYETIAHERHETPVLSYTKSLKWIFPFTFHFQRNEDKWVYPSFADWSYYALILNIILAGLLFYVKRRRKENQICLPLITVFCGLFSFIPALFIRENS